jgi:plasmid maintenance system antidote protein VapI
MKFSWKMMAIGLGFKRKTLTNVSEGTKGVSANMVFRIARMGARA